MPNQPNFNDYYFLHVKPKGSSETHHCLGPLKEGYSSFLCKYKNKITFNIVQTNSGEAISIKPAHPIINKRLS